MTRADLILAAGITLLSFLMIAFSFSHPKGGKAEVFIDNESAGVLSLSEEGVYSFDGMMSPVKVEVKEGGIKILESGCPLHLCMKRGSVSRVGETVVCLPNRLLIVITSGKGLPVHGVTG